MEQTDTSVMGSKKFGPAGNSYTTGEEANKQSGNREKASSSMPKAKYFEQPNQKQGTAKAVFSKVSGDNQADKGVKLAAKRSKKIIRSNALYSDKAIAVAKRMRGME